MLGLKLNTWLFTLPEISFDILFPGILLPILSDMSLKFRESSDLDKTVCIVLTVVRPRVENFFLDTWLFSLRSHSLCEGLIYILCPFFLLSFSLAEFVLLSRPCVKYICFACPCLNSSSNFLNFLPSFVCETFTTC